MKRQTADTLFQILAKATPLHMRFPPDQSRTLISDIISKTSMDLDHFYDTYKKCRSGEEWIRELKRNEYRFKKRQSLIAKFRTAWANEIRGNNDFWGDLFIVAAWSDYTRRDVAFINTKIGIVHWIRKASHDPEDTLILTQQSNSSCYFGQSEEDQDVLKTMRIVESINDHISQTVRASRYTLGLDGATGKSTKHH